MTTLQALKLAAVLSLIETLYGLRPDDLEFLTQRQISELLDYEGNGAMEIAQAMGRERGWIQCATPEVMTPHGLGALRVRVDTERQRFEREDTALITRHPDGSYKDFETESRWQLWQVAVGLKPERGR